MFLKAIFDVIVGIVRMSFSTPFSTMTTPYPIECSGMVQGTPLLHV